MSRIFVKRTIEDEWRVRWCNSGCCVVSEPKGPNMCDHLLAHERDIEGIWPAEVQDECRRVIQKHRELEVNETRDTLDGSILKMIGVVGDWIETEDGAVQVGYHPERIAFYNKHKPLESLTDEELREAYKTAPIVRILGDSVFYPAALRAVVEADRKREAEIRARKR